MSKLWQLGALMKKNVILMKRSCCATCCEILFPLLLMFLLVIVRRLIKITEYTLPSEDINFTKLNSTAILDTQDMATYLSAGQSSSQNGWNGMTIRNPLAICRDRSLVAVIGTDKKNLDKISAKISKLFSMARSSTPLSFKSFDSVNASDLYITNTEYGASAEMPKICFGFYFNQINETNFDYSLHYSDTILRGGQQDTPSTLKPSLDPFQTGPDLNSFQRWINSGYFQIYKIINDVILQIVTNNSQARIDFGIVSQKYTTYKEDAFANFIGFILPFFLIIAYLAPLCVLVFRMVQDKESRAKEGMKIMGLSEGIYFLSYFLHWLVLNTVYSIINSAILTRVLTNIGFLYILGFFWLFGMCIFAMAYFFQAIMDKTRIAMIISILVYFIMYFVSVAVLSEDVDNIAKMFISILPPTCLQLGISVLAKFESSSVTFKGSDVSYRYQNYSVADMYLMLFFDFWIYLFLGYYLQNTLSHQFGIRRPWYFLCTKGFWFKKKSNKISAMNNIELQQSEQMNINVAKPSDQDNFQSEQSYSERRKNGECLEISDLRKTFDDGKVAVDGFNLNLYNQEIFALLGHNGAGKSTTISILCGLYEATSGKAMYKGENILDDANMNNFRKKLGICPQHDVLFENLTVREHLDMFSVFKGVSGSQISEEIEKILVDVNMTEKGDDLAKNLSGGQKRKLSIAIALIGGSEIVFLDEPSSGMDITSRRNLWEILKKCIGNRIIVLTTHYMEEAAVLGNRIGIVSNGKLKCCGNGLFLIDKFGKYISVNIYKNEGADDNKIIEFVRRRIPNVEYEILSEEILFRIPKDENTGEVKSKNKSFSFKDFFGDLDQQIQELGIKSYGASMPTLEDVFLNVSADTKMKLIQKDEKGEVFKFNDHQQLGDTYEENSGFSKFITDLKVSLFKRFIQVLRDKKTFVLEVFCPIILVLIGLGVSSVQFIKNSPAVNVNLNQLPSSQTIFINSNYFNNNPMEIRFTDTDKLNITFDYQTNNNAANLTNTLYNFNNQLFRLNNTNSYGSYYIIDFDTTKHVYQYVSFVNTQSRNAPIIYADFMTKQIINIAANKKININFVHKPIPIENKLRKQGETRNSSNLVFFVSIAFALIPANFITIIVKERESNTKHLQIISGISLTSYWLSNFIFELIKYYFIGGINLLIIYGFGNFPYYLWLLYLLYGPAMTSFTYTFALFFSTEASAQNAVILINFLIGALGGTVIVILRVLEDLVMIGKILSYIFRVIPSFAFAYGYNQLLSSLLLFAVDYPDNFFLLALNTDENIIKVDYVGTDCIYLAVEFVVYLLVLIIWESSRGWCHSRTKSEKADYTKLNDSLVVKEIEKANSIQEDGKYSITVKNLEKKFGGGCSGEAFTAVNKLSFCLEFGECFALLGVNGAGKTTTFKALTLEHLATSGEIYINGLEITSNFNRVRNLIGYCPQFDAIFDYMTVSENLDFYAKLKGIPVDKVDSVVNALMEEMNLAQYKDKISGNLSGGNKRKLSVAIAMIGNPPIVLLDEPSTGMDPEARRFMWAVIHKISTRSKKSSVILTTHSMEEAETLCRRMGIMVKGQFKCIGTGQNIKNKYGFGFEIDLRVQILQDDDIARILSQSNLNANNNISDLAAIQTVLGAINKNQLANQFNDLSLGREILDEINSKGKITVRRLIEWSFYTENALRCIDKILNTYESVSIIEFWDNNFKLKIKKNNSNNSIGFLFGLIEDLKSECSLAEYSISQTSLEQIFNKFASEDDAAALQLNDKKELKMSKDVIRQLLA